MTAMVEVPTVEAAPQDAHGDTDAPAQQTVVAWRALPNVHRETVGRGITVGVVDTKFGSHAWYASQVHGDSEQAPVDGLLQNNYKAGHATFVAGLVLQQAPAADVVVKGVLDSTGSAPIQAVTAGVLELVRRRKVNGKPEIDILNLSFGSYGSDDRRQAFLELLNEVWTENPGLIVVAAAGNRRVDETRPFYPAALAPDHARLVSVGAAADAAGTQWANFSNQGPDITFRVWGTGLVSTFLRFTTGSGNPDGRWARWGGTSFSTAIVSGMIAATMAPAEGSPPRTGQQAVADLLAGAPRPVSLPVEPFPALGMQSDLVEISS